MRQSSQYPSERRLNARSCSGTRAFTLVEIGVVVLIISLVAAIAVPQIKSAIITARSEAVINDLRVLSQAFQHYLQENGDWPATPSAAGAFPAGMAGYLRESAWTRKTPIGGYYVWDTNVEQAGQHVRAAIGITSTGDSAVSADRIQLSDIDRRFDDGNLATGSFRLGFYNEPVYVIEY